ncbi:MAG: FHA domain-containing protein [Planctomycetota bacterium]|nr:MAG: FHA domain-containing protein [Planctomycetota bacterium]
MTARSDRGILAGFRQQADPFGTSGMIRLGLFACGIRSLETSSFPVLFFSSLLRWVDCAMNYTLTLQNHVEGLHVRSWSFSPPVTVGREPTCDLCINHDSISRKHCQFFTNAEGALVVKDLDSLNGTYVDDRRIQQAVLMPGQVVQLGALQLRIDFSEEEDDQPKQTRPAARSSGSMHATQPLETFRPVQIPQKKSWWQKLLGR